VPRAGKGPATKEPRGWSTLRATESGSIVVVGTFSLAYRGIFLRARFRSAETRLVYRADKFRALQRRTGGREPRSSAS
jgi:hypothetical protein